MRSSAGSPSAVVDVVSAGTGTGVSEISPAGDRFDACRELLRQLLHVSCRHRVAELRHRYGAGDVVDRERDD